MKHLPNDVRQKESYARFYKSMKKYSSLICEVEDHVGVKHQVIKGYEIEYHNIGKDEIKQYFLDSHICSYVRLCYYLLMRHIIKVVIRDNNGQKVTYYYLSSSILDFNISNEELINALDISSSTLNEDIVMLESLGIISRKIIQESLTNKKRHFSIDINKLMNFMLKNEEELYDSSLVKCLKHEYLQVRKIILYRILTIVRPGFKRGFEFQKFLKYQCEKLNLKINYIIYKKKSSFEGYHIDPDSGEMIHDPLESEKEAKRLALRKMLINFGLAPSCLK